MNRLHLFLLAILFSVSTLSLSACSSDSDTPNDPDIKGTGKIEGVVTDSRDGGGIGGIDLSLVGMTISTKSASSGSYSFKNLPPGVYQVLAKKDNYGYQFSAIVDVEADKTTTLPIDMVPIIGDWRLFIDLGSASGFGDLKLEDDQTAIYTADGASDSDGGTWKLKGNEVTIEFEDLDWKLTGTLLTNMTGDITQGSIKGGWSATPN